MGKNVKNRKSVGLALGGGGWRGIAHIGVLKVLEQHNIPIDYIAGTSIGSLVGGLYDYFGSAQELEKFILKFGYRDLFKATSDPKLKNGLLSGEKLVNYLNKLTKNTRIEDLPIPFCAVTSDMISGNSHYIKNGKLSEAIRASISIPLVFRPVKSKGMYLIDGGATENIPVNCLKAMGADITIGVHVNSAFFPVSEKDVSSSAKIAVVSARIMLNKMSERLLSQADIAIEPKIPKKVSGSGLGYFLNFVKEKGLIRTGEEAANQVINKIERLIK